ncbi:MAG: hypothetical protein OS130_06235 [Thermodesulfobacteriota bacterium]|jgi:hypothetical protein|nr:MAG: hypothetical protein OS130_06235 [Thermodesulfobacteriota bacterium]
MSPKIKNSPFLLNHNTFRFVLVGSIVIGGFLFFGIGKASAAQIKILSDSRHAYSRIISVINQLLGKGHVGTDIIVDSTNMGSFFIPNVNCTLNASATNYDHNGDPVRSRAPYQLFTTSAQGYRGDSDSEYNLSASHDLAHNFAYTSVLPVGTPPPAFHIAPGGDGWHSGAGIEWTLDCSVFDCRTLSALTAENAGIMTAMRYNHPTWNWFDTKAALRQTATNWKTGYNPNSYGFGTVNYVTANALRDNQLSLQPPEAIAETNFLGAILFHLYPFKQTRRVKEVLFQFGNAPSFHGSELTISQIQALGGTKVMEYSGITSQTFAPLTTGINNAYFVWFTADNANDNAASFSRIDTYSVLGPLNQVAI